MTRSAVPPLLHLCWFNDFVRQVSTQIPMLKFS